MELFLIFAKCTQPYNSISKAALVQSSVITVTKQNFCFVTLKSEGARKMPMKYSKIMLHKVQAVQLPLGSRDLSQAENKATVVKLEQIHKMTIF